VCQCGWGWCGLGGRRQQRGWGGRPPPVW
jgi:hypothetical protein